MATGRGAQTPRRTQRERREGSERALLDAAATLIAERGSSRTSFADIAALAGCSHSHPHYLFGSKTAMLEALVVAFGDRFSEQVIHRLVGDAAGLAGLTRCVSVFLRSLADPWPMTRALYVLLGESLGATPELRPALAAYHRRLRGMIAAYITQGIDAGEIDPTIDADAEAAAVVALVRGIGYQVLSDPDAFDLGELEGQVVGGLERRLAAPRR